MLELPEPWIPAQESANRQWDQPKRKKCVAASKAERSWTWEERLTSDVKMWSLKFSQMGFGFALVQDFLSIIPFPPFGNGNVYLVALYVGSI